MTEEQRRAAVEAVARAVADLRAHRPVDTAGMPASIALLFQALDGPNLRFVDSDDAVDPASVAG